MTDARGVTITTMRNQPRTTGVLVAHDRDCDMLLLRIARNDIGQRVSKWPRMLFPCCS